MRNDPNAAHIEAQAVVVDDETLLWMVFRSVGQDYNYEPARPHPSGPRRSSCGGRVLR